MGNFELRTATNEDCAGIADGFARVTGGDADRIRQHVAYALRDNPHGSSSVVAADPHGRIIAHMGVTHVPMQVKGKPLLFGPLPQLLHRNDLPHGRRAQPLRGPRRLVPGDLRDP